METQLIHTDGRGIKRNVGHISGTIYYTNRDWKNLFSKFQGFGISTRILGALNHFGIETIEINFCDYTFSTTPLMYCSSGCDYYDGQDRQKVLNLNLFNNHEHQIELNLMGVKI